MIDSGDTRGAVAALRAVVDKERERRLKKCIDIFQSPAICRNYHAQPFYLWAQMAVRNLVNGPIYQELMPSKSAERNSQ